MPHNLKQKKDEIFCVDPCLHIPEVEAFEFMASCCPISMTHHLPVQKGLDLLELRESQVSLRGLILLGSACSIFDNLAWQKPFHKWVEKKILEKVPILAICYSHQLIANFFGAEVNFLASGKKLKGCREIYFESTNLNLKSLPNKGFLLASHYEEVSSLPNEMFVLASSKQLKYEAFIHKSLPIYTFQTHLEARSDFCKNQKIELSKNCYSAFKFGEDIIRSFFGKILSL